SNVEEALFIVFRVEIDAVPDPAKQRTAQTIVSYSVAQVHHCVGFAPVLAVFPNLNRRATNLIGNLDQLRIIGIAAVSQKDLVVLRNQLRLELIDCAICLHSSIYMAKLVRNLCGRESVAADAAGGFGRHQRVHYGKVNWIWITFVQTHSKCDRGGDELT